MASLTLNQQNCTINVPFHGTELYVVNYNGEPFTPMRPIIDGMGMDWASQFTKLKSRFAKGVVEIAIPTAGGIQKMICLALRKLAAWLNTISPNKVKPEIRDRVIQYQDECDDVLYEYWTKGQVTNPRKANAAPGKITKEQQTTIKELVMSRGHSLPKDKQAKAIITMWSALKAHFGITYKEIGDDQFDEAISLVSRLPLEGELIEAPKVSGVTIPASEMNTLIWLWDYANRAQAVFRELHRPMREIQSHYAGKCHDYGSEFATVINLSRDVLSKMSHEVDMERADGTTNLSAWKRLQSNELPPSFLLK
ncbi:TPA: phage antirepressor Ant [Citrobacter freundii]|nr:phage antirepressor Ant [Citrobacter freundii]